MTYNEEYEAMYYNAVSRVQALFAGAPTPGEVVRELERVGWRPITPQELATHQVKLVAESQEALIETLRHITRDRWPDGTVVEMNHGSGKLGRELADALLASGVVQVTPTEEEVA